jgi:tetratricopeptide (TPR) repeat protein
LTSPTRGRESLPVVVDLSTIGQLYLRQGKYAASEHAYAEALEISIRLKGEGHPETATCQNNLALLYRNMGDYSKAEGLLRRGLAIREQNFGGDHPLVAQNLINLADILVAADKDAEAEPLLLRALKLKKALLVANMIMSP